MTTLEEDVARWTHRLLTAEEVDGLRAVDRAERWRQLLDRLTASEAEAVTRLLLTPAGLRAVLDLAEVHRV